jgi:hypothetical protein
MLLNCRSHQPRRAIDIQTIKMGLSRSANSAGTVYHGIGAADQTPQAVRVFKRALDPMNIIKP